MYHLHFEIPHYNLPKAHELLQDQIKEVYMLKRQPLKHLWKYKYQKKLGFVKNQQPYDSFYLNESFQDTKVVTREAESQAAQDSLGGSPVSANY